MIVFHNIKGSQDILDMKSGDVGLAIMTSIGLIRSCQYGMRQSAEFENQMTSVERLIEYINLPSEAKLETEEKNRLASKWPSCGAISFRRLNLRYTEKNSFSALKNLTMNIRASVRFH